MGKGFGLGKRVAWVLVALTGGSLLITAGGYSLRSAWLSTPSTTQANTVALGHQNARLLAAEGDRNPMDYLPAEQRSQVQTVQTRIAAIKAAMHSGGYVARVDAVLAADGVQPPALAPLPRPDASQLAAVSTLPLPMRAPVAGLYAAVMKAVQMLGVLPRADMTQARQAMFGYVESVASTGGRPNTPGGQGSPAPVPLTLAPSIRHAIGATQSATLLIAAALDAYLPALRASASSAPSRAGIAVNGCDLVDQTPYLCVGGNGNNTYTEDEALLIDTGGHDTYLNSAGGAAFLPPGGAGYIPVSVNVDLDGGDDYAPSAQTLQADQAADGGALYGVGIAVAGGDDTFNASLPLLEAYQPAYPQGVFSDVATQGAGIAGTGLLFELNGSNSFSVNVDPPPPNSYDILNQIIAQGASFFGCATGPGNGSAACALGMLADLGAGNDSYSVDGGAVDADPSLEQPTTPADQQPFTFENMVLAQGAGGFESQGLLYSEGATNSYSAHGTVSNHVATYYPSFTSALGTSRLDLQAQGSDAEELSNGSLGMLLDVGTGDTTYTIDGEGSGIVSVNVVGQGAAVFNGGTGVLEDDGGTNSFVARAHVADAVVRSVDDTCGCASAQASVSYYGDHDVETDVQGSTDAYPGELGLLWTASGNNTYVVDAQANLTVALHDELSTPTAPPSLQVMGYGLGYVRGQGASLGGVLVDQGGDDSYQFTFHRNIAASADSLHAQAPPRVVAVGATEFETFYVPTGQGGAGGWLLDLGGSHAAFSAVAVSHTTTAPNPDGAFDDWSDACDVPSFDGYGVGGLVALASTVSVLSEPSTPVATPATAPPQYRGFGAWQENGYLAANSPAGDQGWQGEQVGSGYVPGNVGVAPTLTVSAPPESVGQTVALIQPSNNFDLFLPDNYDANVPRIAVSATLKLAGAPVAGATVHFDLQDYHVTGTVGLTQWGTIEQVDSTTGSDGVATARLPLAIDTNLCGSPSQFQVAATFDGSPSSPTGGAGGVYPAHAASPITINATPLPTPAPTPTPTPGPCSSSLCFGAPVVLPQSGNSGGTGATCYSPCGEPSLAVSPVDGTLYVSTPRTIVVCCNTLASPVWKSSDDGNTWSNPIFPSAPGGQNPLTGGDTELAIDKRGTVYEGELWLGSDSIYISPDKGSTWSWSPASHDVGADREWFAYAPGEDALYGFYDGFKGLMVAKAPLSTPAGSAAASFFPVERVVVPECAAGLATNCPSLPANSVAGTPIIDGTESPGRPSVAPDGTLYFPFGYQVAGQGIGIASTSDGGQTYQYNYVTGAGKGVLGDTGNDWPVTAVDSAGNLYVAWIEDFGGGDGFAVYYSASTNKGATWTTPTEVSKGISATAVFPNIVAGYNGQVAVSWYGTSTAGDPNSVPNASWNVDVAETLDGAAASPTFSTGVVQQNFHTGDICTQGLACTGTTRELLDFFDMKIDKTGALGVVYTRDQTGGVGTEIAFSRQVGGCVLTAASCGLPNNAPEAPSVAGLAGAGLLAAGIILLVRRRRRSGRGLPAC